MPTPRRIPILAVRFTDALPTQQDVQRRLINHLLSLRDDRWAPVGSEPEPEPVARSKLDATPGVDWIPSGKPSVYDIAAQRRRHFIHDADHLRIDRRARRYVERVTASTGLAHLGKDDVRNLSVLRDGATLIAILNRLCCMDRVKVSDPLSPGTVSRQAA